MVYSRAASHDDSSSIKVLRRLLAYDFGSEAKQMGGRAALHDETIRMQLMRAMRSYSAAPETPVFGANLRFIDSNTGVTYVTH